MGYSERGEKNRQERATPPTAIKWFIHAIQNCQGYFFMWLTKIASGNN